MSNFNDANEFASNLVFGTHYHNNEPMEKPRPKQLVFRRTTYVTITADAHTDKEWRKVSGEIEDVLNEGYWLDCNATLATSPLDDMDTAYTLDNLERLDFNRFDLRPETASELDYEQERLAAEEKSEQHAQADQVPARVWFAELKAKFHSKEGIRQLAIEHANDPMPNCIFRECANVPRIRSTDDANGNWVLNINGCELYIRSHRWGGGDNNNTTITIGNRRGQKDPVEPRFESQFDFIDGKLRYHYKIEDMEDLL
jgi:hypothetical protein